MKVGRLIKELQTGNTGLKVFAHGNASIGIGGISFIGDDIMLVETHDKAAVTAADLAKKLAAHSSELKVSVGYDPVMFVMEKNGQIFLVTEKDGAFGLILSETVSSLLGDKTVTVDEFYTELYEIGITTDMVGKYFSEEAALQMEAYYKEKPEMRAAKNQRSCINEINEWCKDFIRESGIDYLRPDITLGKYSDYGFFVNSSGIMAEHPYVRYNSDELGKEGNLIGQELIARWDEIRSYLIYLATVKSTHQQNIEKFDVGAPYGRKKGNILAEENEKYVLIFSDGESIDATTYNSKEEAYANMKKAYEEAYPEGQEEGWADMSYLGDDSALLYLNGDGVCCWDIHTVQFTDAQRIHPAIQDEVSEMQKYTKSMLQKAREEC